MEALQKLLELPWVLLVVLFVFTGGATAFLAVAAVKILQFLRWFLWRRFRPGG